MKYITSDIPQDVIAVGNPCKVLPKITDEDKINMKAEKEIQAAESKKKRAFLK
ncbi:MAG: hypothetical protein IJA27_09450 [Lachnospiraceae bacterium]|nr:hypothetical protein [Lachnospiraceae bacterium]